MSLKLTVRTPDQSQWLSFPMSLLLTFNRLDTFILCFTGDFEQVNAVSVEEL